MISKIVDDLCFVAAAVSVFVYVKNENNSMNELFNANVEALANNEGGGKKCYRELISDLSEQVVYCGTCEDVPGRGRDKSVCYK